MEYTWKLERLKRKTTSSVTNAVVQTNWTKTGTNENGVSGTFSGATPFELESVDSENFVSYENLTEEKILEWIKSVVVGGYEEHVNEQIAKQIEEQVNPETEDSEVDFPWTTETE